MLATKDNELITQTGPGTPMGNLMRQYWIPVVRSDELPSPDCPPVRIRVLSENLIAFRVTSGNVGVFTNSCPHRGASMFFGRNEEEGLRCVYHGWKFNTAGVCLDMPSEPEDSNFKDKVRIRAYPTYERNGVVWAYMGPRETPPPLPEIEANMMEGSTVTTQMIACNWSLAIENNLDQAHVIFLHYGAVPPEAMDDPETPRKISATQDDYKYVLGVKVPQLEVYDQPFGAFKIGLKSYPDDPNDYWRRMNFIMPFYTQNGVGRLGSGGWMVATVPIDDEHCMSWGMAYRPRPANVPNNATAGVAGGGRSLLPNTTDWLGRFRPVVTAATDYNIDREVQKYDRTHAGYSGISAIGDQDRAITESTGPIPDRSIEHLGTTDKLIISMRRKSLNAAKALQAQGTVPPGVEEPWVYRQRSGWILLPKGIDYWTATKEMSTPQIPVEAAVRAG